MHLSYFVCVGFFRVCLQRERVILVLRVTRASGLKLALIYPEVGRGGGGGGKGGGDSLKWPIFSGFWFMKG